MNAILSEVLVEMRSALFKVLREDSCDRITFILKLGVFRLFGPSLPTLARHQAGNLKKKRSILRISRRDSCHKRQKSQAPTPQAPIRNRQTRKVANAKGLNRNTNLT